MFLNANEHFLNATGYATPQAAYKKMMKVTAKLTHRPLLIIVARQRRADGEIDHVIVCILAANSLHNAMFYASNGIYVTNTVS